MRRAGFALAVALLLLGGVVTYTRTRPPEAPYALVGRVFDVEGSPLAGVRVTATRTGPPPAPEDPVATRWRTGAERARRRIAAMDAPVAGDPAPDEEGRSSADGSFSIRVKEPGFYTLRALPGAPKVGGRGYGRVLVGNPPPPVWLHVADGVPLAGRVVDAEGRPVAGAVVRGSWPRGEGYSAASVPGVATAADGTFAWEAVPTGTCTVSVDLPGRGTVGGLTMPSPRLDPWVVRLPATCTLRGRVTDPTGAGIADVDLLVTTGGASSEWVGVASELRGRSGPDGAYRIEGACPGPVWRVLLLPSGAHLAEEQIPPWAPWSYAEAQVGGDLVLDLGLSRGAAIEVTVLDEAGEPLAGAEVTAHESLAGRGIAVREPETVLTDRAGRARLEGLALGKHLLHVRHATHYLPELERAPLRLALAPDGHLLDPLPPAAIVVVLMTEGEVARKTLRLARGLSVTGRVTGPDGTPISGAVVSRAHRRGKDALRGWGARYFAPQPEGVRTAPDGRFRLDALVPTQALRLRVEKAGSPGAVAEPFPFVLGAAPPDAHLVLPAGGSLAGTVIGPDGAPSAGCSIEWREGESDLRSTRTAACDGAGAFQLEGLPRGALTLRLRSTSGIRRSLRVEPPLRPGERRQGFVARLVRSVGVSGFVVDTEGRPVGGVTLSLDSHADREWSGFADSLADGSFLHPEVPPGAVEIEPLVDVPVEDDPDWIPWDQRGQVVDAPAEGVRIVIPPPRKTRVSARILGPDGAPIPLCFVVATRPGDEGDSRLHVRLEHEVVGGEFRRELAGAPPFRLSVVGARDADGLPLNLAPKPFSIPGDAEVEVRLEPGREVEGRVVGPDWRGVAGVSVRAGGSVQESGSDGGFRLRGLPVGVEVTVEAEVPAGWLRPEAQMLARDETSLRIPLSKGLAIAGQAFGPDGEPVQRGRVVVEREIRYVRIEADGRFRVEGLVPGAVVDLRFTSGDAYDGGERTVHMPAVKAGTEDLRVAFEEGVPISGVVIDAKGRRGRSGTVEAKPLRAEAGADRESDASIGLDGRFAIAGLQMGPHELRVESHEGGKTTLTVDAPAHDVRAIVPYLAKLRGRLIGTGPRSGFRVSAYVRSAGVPGIQGVAERLGSGTTDARGRFTISVPRDGPFELVALKPDDDRFARAREVQLGTGDLRMTLEAGLAVEGVVEDAGGRPPPPGTWVDASSPDGCISVEVLAAGSGAFLIRGLPPGPYRLTCRRPRGESTAPIDAPAGTSGHRLILPGR